MAETGVDIETIGTFRRGSHAEQKLRIGEVAENPLITFGSDMVRLVNEDVVEFAGREPFEHVRFAHSLGHGEQVPAVSAPTGAGQQAQFIVRAAEHFSVGGHRVLEDLFSFGHIQHAPRIALPHVERGEIGFAGTGGGDNDGTVFAVRTQLFQAGQRFALHGVGFDLLAFALFEDRRTRWCLMTQLLFVALEILFVLGNPRLGERFGIGKLGFHLRLDLIDEFAAFQGRDFEIPLALGVQGRLGQVGTADIQIVVGAAILQMAGEHIPLGMERLAFHIRVRRSVRSAVPDAHVDAGDMFKPQQVPECGRSVEMVLGGGDEATALRAAVAFGTGFEVFE